MAKNIPQTEINDKAERIMNGVDTWCSFYRANPHRFVKDYLNIHLRLFQQIILFMMNLSTNVIYCASRGQGLKRLIFSVFYEACLTSNGFEQLVRNKA